MAGLIGKLRSEFLGAEFDHFLFAPVCTDKNGRSLSVVSMLARLDLDPWAQAAGLAKMPRKLAIHSLAALLAGRPERGMTGETSDAAATRLVGLLPSTVIGKPAVALPWRNIIRKWRAVFVICLFIGAATQVFSAHARHQASQAATAGRNDVAANSGHK